MRACCILSLLRIEYDRYSSSILYESSTKVRKYHTKVLSYESNLLYLRRYFRTLLVRKYFRISGSTEEYTTYFHYVRTFITFVRKYESTTTRTRTCTTTSKVHVHVAIFTGSFINTRSYCTTRATRTCTCT